MFLHLNFRDKKYRVQELKDIMIKRQIKLENEISFSIRKSKHWSAILEKGRVEKGVQLF